METPVATRTRSSPSTTPSTPVWLNSAKRIFKQTFGQSPHPSLDSPQQGLLTPSWLKEAEKDVYVYKFGSIRAAAWDGNREEFERSVNALRKDHKYRASHPVRALVADVLVSTGVPKLLLTVRDAATQ